MISVCICGVIRSPYEDAVELSLRLQPLAGAEHRINRHRGRRRRGGEAGQDVAATIVHHLLIEVAHVLFSVCH